MLFICRSIRGEGGLSHSQCISVYTHENASYEANDVRLKGKVLCMWCTLMLLHPDCTLTVIKLSTHLLVCNMQSNKNQCLFLNNNPKQCHKCYMNGAEYSFGLFTFSPPKNGPNLVDCFLPLLATKSTTTTSSWCKVQIRLKLC